MHWRSEAEHATSRSRRLPTILTFTRGWGRIFFCFFQTAETRNRTPNSGAKGSGANHYPRAPAHELDKLCFRLKLHKPTLNIRKMKCLILRSSNQKIDNPVLLIENTAIETVESRNSRKRPIILNKYLMWTEHITKVALKISRSIRYF